MDMAVSALKVLNENFPKYAKTHSAKLKFFSFWLKLDEAKRKAHLDKVPTL